MLCCHLRVHVCACARTSKSAAADDFTAKYRDSVINLIVIKPLFTVSYLDDIFHLSYIDGIYNGIQGLFVKLCGPFIVR